VKFIFVLFFLVFISKSWGSQAQEKIICNLSGNQMELNICAWDEFNKNDSELNKLYQEKITSLNNQEYPEYKDRLKKAQQAWIKFRDATCLYEVGARGIESGSMWPMNQAYCKAELTKARIKTLKDYVKKTTH